MKSQNGNRGVVYGKSGFKVLCWHGGFRAGKMQIIVPDKEEEQMGWKFTNDRSIYMQLIEQIQNRIATGYYEPGGRLPSVRELAAEAEVNPNTMQKALAELERQELLFSQRTAGRFVTENEGRILNMKKEVAKGAVDVFLKQMENLGLKESEIIELIREAGEEKEDE